MNQQQRTLYWHRQRLGKYTGSEIWKIMQSRSNDVPTETSKSYIAKVAGERLLNPDIVEDDEQFAYYLEQTSVNSKAMRFGTEWEPIARETYARQTGNNVVEVGFTPHPKYSCFGSSPDGVVMVEGKAVGCIEIKVPNLDTFAQYAFLIRDGKTLKSIKREYYYQCQAHMAVTDTPWCDFIAYSPYTRRPLAVARIERDEAEITRMLQQVDWADSQAEKIATIILHKQ